MSNSNYLQHFQNLIDVTEAHGGLFYDPAIIEYVTDKAHPGEAYPDLDEADKIVVRQKANDLAQATMFLDFSDKRRYGKLLKELENMFTRGNNDYPLDLVKAYNVLCEYKCWTPKMTTPLSTDVAFVQTGDTDVKNTEWHKKATCHNCGKKGHIRPNCRENEEESEPEEEKETEPKVKKPTLKKKVPKSKKNKKDGIGWVQSLVKSCLTTNFLA